MKIVHKKTTKEGIVQITTTDERWYFREEDEAINPSSSWISQYVPKGKQFETWLKQHGDESDEIKRLAGEKGGRVHNVIAAMICCKMDGKPTDFPIDSQWPDSEGEIKELSPEEVETVISFCDWWKETEPEPVASEQTCWSEVPAYAGTLDFKFKKDGVLWLVDFKTSQSIYLSHEVQLASYAHTPEGSCDKLAILQIGYRRNKKRFKFTEIEDKFNLFMSAYSFWAEANENVRPHQYEFPKTLTI